LLQFPYHPSKTFLEFFTTKFAKTLLERGSESFWFFSLKREEHIRREPRGRQRKLAFFSARALYAAQNDVKFSRTHAAKVFVHLFQKVAPRERVLPYKHQFINEAQKALADFGKGFR